MDILWTWKDVENSYFLWCDIGKHLRNCMLITQKVIDNSVLISEYFACLAKTETNENAAYNRKNVFWLSKGGYMNRLKTILVGLLIFLLSISVLGLLGFGITKIMSITNEDKAEQEQLNEDRYILDKKAEDLKNENNADYIENASDYELALLVYGKDEADYLDNLPTINENDNGREFPDSQYDNTVKKYQKYFHEKQYELLIKDFKKLVQTDGYNFTTNKNSNIVRIYNSAIAASKISNVILEEKVEYFKYIEDPLCYLEIVLYESPSITKNFSIDKNSKLAREKDDVSITLNSQIIMNDYKNLSDIPDEIIAKNSGLINRLRAVYIYEITNKDGVSYYSYIYETYDLSYGVIGNYEIDSNEFLTYDDWSTFGS